MLIAGTAVAIEGRAILLLGASQSGKSDLALRLIDAGATLIADDTVEIAAKHDWINAVDIPLTSGRLAVRGIGICKSINVHSAPLSLALNLVAQPITEGAPALGAAGPWHGCHIPLIDFFPFEMSAVIKARLVLERYGL